MGNTCCAGNRHEYGHLDWDPYNRDLQKKLSRTALTQGSQLSLQDEALQLEAVRPILAPLGAAWGEANDFAGFQELVAPPRGGAAALMTIGAAADRRQDWTKTLYAALLEAGAQREAAGPTLLFYGAVGTGGRDEIWQDTIVRLSFVLTSDLARRLAGAFPGFAPPAGALDEIVDVLALERGVVTLPRGSAARVRGNAFHAMSLLWLGTMVPRGSGAGGAGGGPAAAPPTTPGGGVASNDAAPAAVLQFYEALKGGDVDRSAIEACCHEDLVSIQPVPGGPEMTTTRAEWLDAATPFMSLLQDSRRSVRATIRSCADVGGGGGGGGEGDDDAAGDAASGGSTKYEVVCYVVCTFVLTEELLAGPLAGLAIDAEVGTTMKMDS